jgi:predicted nucleic acid-binding protein
VTYCRAYERCRNDQNHIATGNDGFCCVRSLQEFEILSLVDAELAVKPAVNYRFLRQRGTTIHETIDLIIGTYCIERGHSLLHSDRDFVPMERLLGLQTA